MQRERSYVDQRPISLNSMLQTLRSLLFTIPQETPNLYMSNTFQKRTSLSAIHPSLRLVLQTQYVFDGPFLVAGHQHEESIALEKPSDVTRPGMGKPPFGTFYHRFFAVFRYLWAILVPRIRPQAFSSWFLLPVGFLGYTPIIFEPRKKKKKRPESQRESRFLLLAIQRPSLSQLPTCAA